VRKSIVTKFESPVAVPRSASCKAANSEVVIPRELRGPTTP
jgi:hypothetical protein